MSTLIRKLGPETLRFLDTVRRYRANPVSAARRYWKLYRHRSFSPDEIHFQRLLDPALTESDLQCSVSKEELLAIQTCLNPRELHPRTEDKICFHAFCRQAGLPVPEIFALFDRDGAKDNPEFRVLHGLGGVEQFLRNSPADSFIVKPVDGVNGEGVMRLDRKGVQWRDSHGSACSASGLVSLINRTPYRRWIFQRVVQGHSALRELSDTTGLQTVRVVTAVDDCDVVRILAARLRLICGDIAHDNFEFGKTGNVIAILDPENGRIMSAVGGAKDRYEMQQVTRHPSTHRELIGFEVPNWDAVRELAIEAASQFRPLRTVGWDVAVTSDEPCLIEGNVTWATLSGEPRMGEIYKYLQNLAATSSPTDTTGQPVDPAAAVS